jgi:hypothetical protein
LSFPDRPPTRFTLSFFISKKSPIVYPIDNPIAYEISRLPIGFQNKYFDCEYQLSTFGAGRARKGLNLLWEPSGAIKCAKNQVLLLPWPSLGAILHRPGQCVGLILFRGGKGMEGSQLLKRQSEHFEKVLAVQCLGLIHLLIPFF